MPNKGLPQQSELQALWSGRSVDLLKELHILTRDGQLNRDSLRKLKQVRHLVQLIEPALEALTRSPTPAVADLGAGKSYLGFILYDLWASQHASAQIWAVESRAELVKKSRELADRLAFARMTFFNGSIESSLTDASGELPESIDLVTALHACDGATDQAIEFALRKKAKYVVLVPCCQAELAQQLGELKTQPFSEGSTLKSIEPLWRHPIQRREFASQLTNVIRTLYLEMHGYKVRVTELVGWEHSLKNELIFAEKIQGKNSMAEKQLKALLDQIPVRPSQLRF